MSLRSSVLRIAAQEDINFLLTNRIPRLALTRFMGWFSKLENPLVSRTSIALWRFFCDVDLTDSRHATFESLHSAFIRSLRPDARSVDPDPSILASPSDAIVGAFGKVTGGEAFQIKGFSYSIADLVGDASEAKEFEGGWYITLRLTAGMYHRFHAPYALEVSQVRYISGDTWNVNPIALKRIERLFCRNERAPISARLAGDERIILVPVAAVLVASIRLPFLDPSSNVRAAGPGVHPCHVSFSKGEEMGWFEHGSTIVLLTPPSWEPAATLEEGKPIRMGEKLMRSVKNVVPSAGPSCFPRSSRSRTC